MKTTAFIIVLARLRLRLRKVFMILFRFFANAASTAQAIAKFRKAFFVEPEIFYKKVQKSTIISVTGFKLYYIFTNYKGVISADFYLCLPSLAISHAPQLKYFVCSRRFFNITILKVWWLVILFFSKIISMELLQFNSYI